MASVEQREGICVVRSATGCLFQYIGFFSWKFRWFDAFGCEKNKNVSGNSSPSSRINSLSDQMRQRTASVGVCIRRSQKLDGFKTMFLTSVFSKTMNAAVVFVVLLMLVNDSQALSVTEISTTSASKSNATVEQYFSEVNNPQNCTGFELSGEEYSTLDDGSILLKSYNMTLPVSKAFLLIGGKLCLPQDIVHANESSTSIEHCKKKWVIESHEYQVLENQSVLYYGEILEPGTYKFSEGDLITCVPEDTDYESKDVTRREEPLKQIGIYICHVGSSISIIALAIHLVVFSLVPALRNLPGYNLASMSMAFMMGYSFFLIGQIKEVLGAACVTTGVLSTYFLLAAFFWTNVMAYDVWKALKMATSKLVGGNSTIRIRRFMYYSAYAWGIPTIFMIVSVIADTTDLIPETYRPKFAYMDYCTITQYEAKMLYFVGPVFAILILNGLFFIACAFMIFTNLMKETSDQHVTAKRNFLLYLRLALLMGATWMTAIIASIVQNEIFWLVFDSLNTLHGLYIFVCFTCSRKVYRHFKKKLNKEPTKTTTSNVSAIYRSE